MIVNLVEKYGVVPKSVYPETYSSGSARQLNYIVNHKLREFAYELRKDPNASMDDLMAMKTAQMEVIYKIITMHLGTPPTKFTYRVRGKDKESPMKEFVDVTPQDFYNNSIPSHIHAMVSLVHDPRNEYYKLFTVDYLGNVVGGKIVLYVNVPIEKLKEYVKKTIVEKQEPVWFGCDFGHFIDRKKGIMDMDLFDYNLVYDTKFNLTKKQRLEYSSSLMTHAMVFTGVDVQDEKIVSYRVENSHGKDKGKGGYLQMTDSWFDEYVYQIAVDKSDLDEETLAVLEQTPTRLPAWDPMGALAECL